MPSLMVSIENASLSFVPLKHLNHNGIDCLPILRVKTKEVKSSLL